MIRNGLGIAAQLAAWGMGRGAAGTCSDTARQHAARRHRMQLLEQCHADLAHLLRDGPAPLRSARRA